MAKKSKDTSEDTTVLSVEDIASYQSLVTDMFNENTLPKSGVWTYLAKIFDGQDVYLGAWLYIDGPMIPKSSGAEPSFRRIVWVNGDWSEERVFDYPAQLFTYLRPRFSMFRTRPFTRASGVFVAADGAVMDLRSYGGVA
jgi:hypothetical protein